MPTVNMGSELRHVEKSFIGTIVTVEPGGSRSVALGAYFNNAPQPKFSIALNPNLGAKLEASIDRNEIPGSQRYVLFYRFHNNGSESCSVAVSRVGR